MTYLLALDQGTSSCRSIVFDPSGQTVAMAQKELTQIYPQPGWVEHDALEIWRLQLATAREALASAGITARQVTALGITNQRETTLVWNRKTGQPIHHKTNVLLERHNTILNNHSVDLARVENMAKEAKNHIDSCPARKKVESSAMMIKDIVGLAALLAAIVAILKAFNIIKGVP